MSVFMENTAGPRIRGNNGSVRRSCSAGDIAESLDGMHNLKRFDFERTYSKNGRTDIVRTVSPTPDPLIEAQYNAVQETVRDEFGRTRRIISRTVISPDVFAWFTDPRQWNHTTTTFERDELGRISA